MIPELKIQKTLIGQSVENDFSTFTKGTTFSCVMRRTVSR
jgi:hypothetical protein